MEIHKSAEHVIFTWGRFKGHSLAHVARSVPSYLEWMSGQDGLPEQWRIAAAKTLMNEDISELDFHELIIQLFHTKTYQSNQVIRLRYY